MTNAAVTASSRVREILKRISQSPCSFATFATDLKKDQSCFSIVFFVRAKRIEPWPTRSPWCSMYRLFGKLNRQPLFSVYLPPRYRTAELFLFTVLQIDVKCFSISLLNIQIKSAFLVIIYIFYKYVVSIRDSRQFN